MSCIVCVQPSLSIQNSRVQLLLQFVKKQGYYVRLRHRMLHHQPLAVRITKDVTDKHIMNPIQTQHSNIICNLCRQRQVPGIVWRCVNPNHHHPSPNTFDLCRTCQAFTVKNKLVKTPSLTPQTPSSRRALLDRPIMFVVGRLHCGYSTRAVAKAKTLSDYHVVTHLFTSWADFDRFRDAGLTLAYIRGSFGAAYEQKEYVVTRAPFSYFRSPTTIVPQGYFTSPFVWLEHTDGCKEWIGGDVELQRF